MTSAPRPTRKRLGDLLVDAGVITRMQLESALMTQRQLGLQLGRVLVDQRAITEDGLVAFLARQLGLDVAALPETAPAALSLVPLEDAEKLRVFPLGMRREAKGETLLLAMTDPTNVDVIDAVQFKTGLRVTALIVGESALEGAIRRHYHGERPREVFAASPVQFAGFEVELPSHPDGAPVEEDIPVVTGTLSSPTPLASRAPSTLMGDLFGPAGAFIGADAEPPPVDLGDVVIGRSDSQLITAEASAAQFAHGPFAGLAPPRGTPAPSVPPVLAPVSADAIGLELVPVPTPPPVVAPSAHAPEVASSPWAAATETSNAPEVPWPAVDVPDFAASPFAAPDLAASPFAASPFAAPAWATAAFAAGPSAPVPFAAEAARAPPEAAVRPAPPEAAVPPAPAEPPAPPEAGLVPPAPSPPPPPVAEPPTNVASTGSSSTAPADAPRIALTMAKPDLANLPYCPDCGATRLSGAKFCPHCGCSFTGVTRAKGALPSVAPATRPMMPAVSPVAAALARLGPALTGPGPLDIELLEGVKPFLTGNVVNLRPRTATAADVDEPALLVIKDVAGAKAPSVGLGVTTLATALVSDASTPDEPESMGLATLTSMAQLTTAQGGQRQMSPVAPMRLHLVTQAMARVDDADRLGPADTQVAAVPLAPPAGARSNAAPSSVASIAAPSSSVASSGALSTPTGPDVDINAIESQWAARLTSQGGLVDDATALATGGKSGFALGLGVTHQAAVFADAALVDDPAVLSGGAAPKGNITRAVINGTNTGFGRSDDVDVIAPGAPPQWQRAREPVLHKDWADAAEKMIPRKDDRSNVDAVPTAREVFFAPDTSNIPPAPAPEPVIAYVPAAPVTAAPAAPWAAFATPSSGLPAPAPAPVAAGAPEPKKPGSATMMMSLDAVELRALAERLVQKGALSNDDVDAAKKK